MCTWGWDTSEALEAKKWSDSTLFLYFVKIWVEDRARQGWADGAVSRPSARPAHSDKASTCAQRATTRTTMRTTRTTECLVCAHCAHDLSTTVYNVVHCLGSLFGTLYMSNVHGFLLKKKVQK